jgi:anti-anti-sigma factor
MTVQLPARPTIDATPTAPAGPGYRVDIWITPGLPPTIVLTGEIDIAAVGSILPALSRLLHDGLITDRLTLRLGEVSFLDCAGLGALIELDNRLRSAGRAMVIEGVSPSALRLLTLTRGCHELSWSSSSAMSIWATRMDESLQP